MSVSIIIPNYNGEKYIKNCLDSVGKQTYKEYEIIVVENASTDNSLNILRSYDHRNIQLIINMENMGFSVAVNQGIRSAKGEYVVLLNNDTEVEVDWLSNLVDSIQADPKIFSVASRMMRFNDRSIIDDAGDYYSILGWAFKNGDGETAKNHMKSKRIFSSCAGAAIYRKCIFDEIGLFDEDFFAYMEDVDIGYRAKLFGYYNAYCPLAIVYHIGSATSGSKYNPFKIQLASRNNIYVQYKNQTSLQLLINSPFLITGGIIKWVFFRKIGYGKLYRDVTIKAIKNIGKIKKVPFNMKRVPYYFIIEFELVVNTFLYFYYYLKKLGVRSVR